MIRRGNNKPNDSWHTDPWIMAIFEWWYDPCPYNPDFDPAIHTDGLQVAWNKHTYVNPPYSNPLPWVEKAIEESKLGKTIVLLLKHDSSTKWYARLHEAGAYFLPITGRLKHGGKKGASFPSVLVVLAGGITC